MVSLYSRANGKHAKLERFRRMHHVLVRVQHKHISGRKHDFTNICYVLACCTLRSHNQ